MPPSFNRAWGCRRLVASLAFNSFFGAAIRQSRRQRRRKWKAPKIGIYMKIWPICFSWTNQSCSSSTLFPVPPMTQENSSSSSRTWPAWWPKKPQPPQPPLWPRQVPPTIVPYAPRAFGLRADSKGIWLHTRSEACLSSHIVWKSP